MVLLKGGGIEGFDPVRVVFCPEHPTALRPWFSMTKCSYMEIITHVKKRQEPPVTLTLLIWFTYFDSKSSQEPGLQLSEPSSPPKLS